METGAEQNRSGLA